MKDCEKVQLDTLCFLFNTSHRKWQQQKQRLLSGFMSVLLSLVCTATTPLSILYLFPLLILSLQRGLFQVGGGWQRDCHTHKSYRHNSGVNTHSSVVLMAAFCCRGDWIRPGADCLAYWLMLPAVLECIVALTDPLQNASGISWMGTNNSPHLLSSVQFCTWW